MTYAIMLGVFVVLLFLGAPIALSLGMSSLLAILYNGTGINVVAGQIYGGIGKYLLLAVPFFVLSGNIMAKAGISDRLTRSSTPCLGICAAASRWSASSWPASSARFPAPARPPWRRWALS